MKCLGRSLKALVISTLILTYSFADVKSRLKDTVIISGDEAELWIEASGKGIEFPTLMSIGGYEVKSQYVSTAISYKSGKKEKKFIKKYLFHPQKSILIPSYEVKIGDKTEKTQAIKLTVKKDPIDVNGSFDFKMIADKDSAYVGEGIVLEFVFKHKINIPISDANFDSPKFKGFWVKKLRAIPNKTDRKNGYKIYRIKYLLYPQYSGTLHIEGGTMDMGLIASKKRRYYSFRSIRRKRLKSNSLDIDVRSLPSGVKLYGDYSFSAVADKTKVKANEPVNYTITIIGNGNVDDIDDFKLNIKDAEVYADAPERLMSEKDGNITVIFKQKFAIVSDRDFTIEPVEFKFFDTISKDIKSIKSKRYEIKVTNPSSTRSHDNLITTKIKEETPHVRATNNSLLALIFALGLLLGGVLTYLFSHKKKKKEKKQVKISQKIYKAKDDKELLSLLLPYLDRSSKMQTIIKDLEKNIYQNGTKKIDKKLIAKEFEDLLIEDEVEEILS